MSLVKCDRCGFIRVEWAPCETCAQDFGLGEIMPEVGGAPFDDFAFAKQCPDAVFGVKPDLPVAQNPYHALHLEDSNLTHRPDGSYMHIGRTKCLRCGERFYYVVNATHPLSEDARKHVDRIMSVGFGEMVAQSPPCKGATV